MTTAFKADIDDSIIPRLEEILSPESSDTKELFVIDSPEKAAWAARKILDAELLLEQYSEQAKQYKRQIDSWFTKAAQESLESTEYLKSLLHPFIEEEISKLSKSKTIRYPGLSIKLRKKPDRIDITDKDIALSFCEANHTEAIIVKKELSKTYLKNLLTKKGEIIPGTTIVSGTTDLYFKDE